MHANFSKPNLSEQKIANNTVNGPVSTLKVVHLAKAHRTSFEANIIVATNVGSVVPAHEMFTKMQLRISAVLFFIFFPDKKYL